MSAKPLGFVEFSDFAKLQSGGTPSKNNPDFWGGDIPWVSAASMHQPIVDESENRVTELGSKNGTKLVPKNTLLILVRGSMLWNRIPICLSGREVTFNQDVKAVITKSKVDTLFLFYWFQSIENKLLHSVVGTGIGAGKLETSDILSLPVPDFSDYEKIKITKILSNWDKSIEATERLLENSKKRKKALMQQLLTGKRRLPGFSGVWSKGTLNSVADVIVSPVDKRTIDGQPEVVLCNYMDVYRNNYITSSVEFMRATASEQEIARFSIRKGDVLITKDSESPDDIAVPALVDEELTGVVCGYHLAIIRPKEMELHGAYLSFLLTTPKVRHYFFTLANGATRFGLSVGAIQNAEFFLPPFNEQVQIARVLRISDDEQTYLSKRLSHLKSEKKALMHQLLTGKKRVNVEEAM